MRGSWLLVGISLALVASFAGQSAKADDAAEREVRKIDEAERVAVLAGDLPAIERVWADDVTVNAPNNQVSKGRRTPWRWSGPASSTMPRSSGTSRHS